MTTPPPDLPDLCWPIDPGCLTEAYAQLEDEVKSRAEALAATTLRRLTAGRVGGCPVTVRPCSQERYFDPTDVYTHGRFTVPWFPILWSGVWINCSCAGACNCTTGCEVKMPGLVGRVDEVNVDGTLLDLSTLSIVDDQIIRWRGTGDCPFPKRQDMTKPLGEPGTFSITYLPSWPVDGLGAWAAGILTLEYAKACTGDKTCRLPKNVTSVIRQGVSLTMTPGSFPNGVTGIPEVDSYIELWNPNHLKAKPAVWSPDSDDMQVERSVT